MLEVAIRKKLFRLKEIKKISKVFGQQAVKFDYTMHTISGGKTIFAIRSVKQDLNSNKK